MLLVLVQSRSIYTRIADPLVDNKCMSFHDD